MKLCHLTDNALVDEAMNRAMRAGTANSGLCFDPMAGVLWEDMQAARTELQQRLKDLRSQATSPEKKHEPAQPE